MLPQVVVNLLIYSLSTSLRAKGEAIQPCRTAGLPRSLRSFAMTNVGFISLSRILLPRIEVNLLYRIPYIVFSVLLLCFSIPAQAEDSEEKSSLPVPRFASLRSGEVNMRVGPGSRYSINWVYKKENWPVEIIQEFDSWREVRDCDGVTGWVHKQMLQGKRMGIIKGKTASLRRSSHENASLIAKMEAGVMVKIQECDIDWCKVQAGGHKGWLPKTSVWGVYRKEKF